MTTTDALTLSLKIFKCSDTTISCEVNIVRFDINMRIIINFI